MAKSSIKHGHGLMSLMLQFTAYVLELTSDLLLKDYDIDNTKRRCAFVMSSIVGISMEFEDINLYQAVTVNYEMDSTKRAAYLLDISNKVIAQVLRAKFYGIALAVQELEKLFQEFLQILQDIALVTSLHDLMRIRIECHVYPHIEADKQHLISTKPHLKRYYERYPVFPIKWRWNPRSSQLTDYLGQCMPTDLNAEMTSEFLVKIVTARIWHRIHEHDGNKEQIHSELGSMFQFSSGDFSLDDKRSLLWPLLLHTRSKPFEDIWRSTYPALVLPTPEAPKRKGCQCPNHHQNKRQNTGSYHQVQPIRNGNVQNEQRSARDTNASQQPSHQNQA